MNATLFSAAALAALLVLPLEAQAQTTIIAADNAANSIYQNGGYAGLNGGFGFTTFNVVTSTPAAGSYAGQFIGDASESEQGQNNAGAIDTSGKAFGTYANGNSTGSGDPTVTVTRGFAVGPTVGDTFSLDFVTGYNDGANGSGHDFVSLTNAAGTAFGTFGYQSGNAYLFNGTVIPNLSYTTGPIHLEYDITSPTTYSLTSSGAVKFSGTGTYAGAVSGFQVQQANSVGNSAINGAFNAYFNNPQETAPIPASAAPEPSQIGVLLLACLGGAAFAARKRLARA